VKASARILNTCACTFIGTAPLFEYILKENNISDIHHFPSFFLQIKVSDRNLT
jgi:hypothetical protein